jgi:hypothetical protein
VNDQLRRARRRTALGLLAAGVLAPTALAAARWPSYWLWIASEQTPMTWLQSVVLVLSAAAALTAATVLGLLSASRRERLPWLVLTAGFLALAFDERFAIHERVRDNVLAPRGVRVPFLPWVAPGDFLVMTVALAGLMLLPLLLRALAPDRTARVLFLVGAGLACVAVGVDSIDPATWSIEAERLQQSLEEVVELAAGLCLLGAVVLRLLTMLAPTPLPAAEVPHPPSSSDAGSFDPPAAQVPQQEAELRR